MTTNATTNQGNVERHAALATTERGFLLRFEVLEEHDCDPKMRSARNADAVQVLAPDMPRDPDPRVALTLAGKRDGGDGIVAAYGFFKPNEARALASFLTAAADAIDQGKPFAPASTLVTWELTISDAAKGSA